MYKFFTTLATLFVALTVSAQSFTVTLDGHAISNGQTFDVGYTQPLPILAAWESVSMTSAEGGSFVCEAYSSTDNYSQLQVCCGGDCVVPSAKNGVVRKEFTLKAGETLDLQIHRGSGPLASHNGTLTAHVTLYAKNAPADKFTYTCNFLVKPASEVGSVAEITTDGDYVKVSGHTLSYSGGGQLTVYNLHGQPVLQTSVSGEGTIDLSHLDAGVYVYQLGALKGKFTVN